MSCCELGNLYNTEAVVNALLAKNIGLHLSHIRGLKDLKKLHLTRNSNYSAEKEVDGEQPAMFCCPVTKMEFNGNHPFVAIWTTGHVLSEKAIKEVGIEAMQEEYGPFSEDDIIKLIPTPSELEGQTARMVARRSKRKADKRKVKDETNDGTEEGGKKRKHKHSGEDSEAGRSGSAGGAVTKISQSASLVKTAAEAIKTQQEQSTVFKGLFHNDKEKDMHGRDLFMSVAGIRYTLG